MRITRVASLILALLLSAALLPFAAAGTRAVLNEPAGAGESGAQTAERLTAVVTMPENREKEAELLTDGCAATHVIFRKDCTVRVDFSGEAENLVTVWNDDPSGVQLICYAGETVLSTSGLDVPFLSTVTPLPEGTTAVELSFTVPKNGTIALSEVYAYGAGELPETEYRWEAAEHPDVLLVAPYPGDEFRFYGGLLPKLINDGVNVAVLYCSDQSRQRLEEGFAALWALGLKTYPVRLNVKAKLSLDYSELHSAWTKAGVKTLLNQALADLKPAVLIAPTGDRHAETEARVASDFTMEILKQRAGLCQKLYLAEDGEKTVTIADEPLPYYGGRSAGALAQEALDSIHSADFWEYRVRAAGTYRLALSQVGSDNSSDTLFDHVTIERNPPATPTPEPTEAPTEEPTEEPTEAPTDTPAPTEPPAATATPIPIGEEDAATEAPTEAPTPTPEQKRGLFSCGGKDPAPTATSAPTAAPTAVPTQAPTPAPTEVPTQAPTLPPTPEPTEAPTEAPTPEPTQAPEAEKFPGHFLAEGEAEQFTMDRENGHWTFRDQNTDIDIRRVNTRDHDGESQIYFVAHIWMRNNQHRSGFGHESRNGRTRGKLYGIARRYGAVLLITGDNMINFEEAKDLKSTLIRDGYVYMDKTGESVMAWNERTLSFDLLEDNSFTKDELLERGYRDVYCFGPILMQDGEIRPKLNYYSHGDAGYKRPRVGVGQVEPGHFVVIVADGKRPGEASGFMLKDYAELFRNEGCVSAYNLDGGKSADIVFMGVHLRERNEKRDLPDCLLFGHTGLLPNEDDPEPGRYEVGTDENGNPVFVLK
ncbi:MAG: phosphodiester glycosidase family protein [Clostridia bacterium]|nr:phosphodiester glycosidase family protein [Clostridia bacterium]